MRIAFPLNSPTELASDFAHSQFIGFYEESEDSLEVVPLQEIKNHLGWGSFPDILISKDLHAIVSMQINSLALRILKDYGIVAFKASGKNLTENIRSFVSRDLEPFTPGESTRPKPCGGGCTSCNSTCS